ncbi:hypothetical protein AB0E27_35500 [Streptomyces sparsogenes]
MSYPAVAWAPDAAPMTTPWTSRRAAVAPHPGKRYAPRARTA